MNTAMRVINKKNIIINIIHYFYFMPNYSLYLVRTLNGFHLSIDFYRL